MTKINFVDDVNDTTLTKCNRLRILLKIFTPSHLDINEPDSRWAKSVVDGVLRLCNCRNKFDHVYNMMSVSKLY